MRRIARAAILLLLAVAAATSFAAEGIRLCLNWAPGADHAPIYFAREQGWFADANVAVDLLPGGGSGDALKKLAAGDCEAAIADFGAVKAAHASGRDVVAVMTIFADSPLAFYSLDSTSITGPADLAGKRIAGYATDPPRRLWPAFAARHSIAGDSATWIDLPNNAKVVALGSGEVDVAGNGFYHHHVEYVEAFGDRLRVLWWRELGPNPIGNVLALSRTWISKHPEAAQAFVRAMQRGYASCAREAAPCVTALVVANPHLNLAREQAKWAAALPLVAPPRRAGMTLGAFDPVQIGPDGQGHDGGEPPYTNALLDPAMTSPR